MRSCVLCAVLCVPAGCGRAEKAAESGGGSPGESGGGAPVSVIEVGFAELAREYDANPLAADDFYKGKRVRVRGVKVHYLSRSADGRAYLAPLSILGDWEPEPTYYFYLSPGATAGVGRGKTLAVEGRCEGFRRDGIFRGLPGADWRVEFSSCVPSGVQGR